MEQTVAAENKRPRIFFLDELRGFLIIFVVWYHLFYDLYLFGFIDGDWFFSPAMNTLRNLFVAALVVISGISSHLSHSNLRRGAKTLAFALVLTAVTWLVIPSQLIIFGILHFFGAAMLLYAPLKKPLSKVPAVWGFALSILLFVLTFNVYYGVFGIESLGLTVQLPSFLYNKPLLFPLGFRCDGLASADYYPLIPWFFAFLAGGFCGDALKNGRFPKFFYTSHSPVLAGIGRHTLIIYLAHQPIIYSLVWLIAALR